MTMPVRGELGERLVADLVREIATEKLTGSLRLTQDKTIKAIFFESGRPVFAISSLPHEQIDHKLIKGKLAAAGLVEAARSKAENPQQLGRTLVQTGVVTDRVMRQAASELATQIVLSLFEWEQADYFFSETAVAELDAKLEWSAADCIVAGVRQSARIESIVNLLAPCDRVIAPSGLNGDSIAASATLSSAEGYVLSSVAGPTTLGDLSLLTALPEDEIRTAVCVLLALELVTPVEASTLSSSSAAEAERPVTEPLPPLNIQEDTSRYRSGNLPSGNLASGSLSSGNLESGSLSSGNLAPSPIADAPEDWPFPTTASAPAYTPPPSEDQWTPNVTATYDPPPSYPSPSGPLSNKPGGRYSQVTVDWVIELASRKLASISNANHYEVLGVERFATTGTISKAYSDLKEMFDSFRSRWPGHSELNKTLDELFTKVDKAYETLSDSNKRRIYDMPVAPPRSAPSRIERGGSEAMPARKPKSRSNGARKPRSSDPSRGLDVDPVPGAYTSGMNRSAALNPSLVAEEHYRRGRAHFERKDFHSAAHLFREAVAKDPSKGLYHYFLGVTLSVLCQARKLHHHDEGCHVTCKIGGSLVRNQRVRREAEQHLLKAAELDRNNAEIRVRLGLLYKEAGMEKKAEQYFNEALLLDASNSIALRELNLDGEPSLR